MEEIGVEADHVIGRIDINIEIKRKKGEEDILLLLKKNIGEKERDQNLQAIVHLLHSLLINLNLHSHQDLKIMKIRWEINNNKNYLDFY